MDFDPARLRRGEMIAAGSAILLLVFMFLLPWYGLKPVLDRTAAMLGTATSFSGWDSLAHVRWLMLLTVVCALALAFFQATRRAPAIPVSLSVIVTTVAVLTVLALLYRVLINLPGSDATLERKVGAYLGILSAAGIVYGGYASLRREGIATKDEPSEIETVRLAGS